MRIVLRLLASLIVLLLLAVGLQIYAAEDGEVAVLYVTDAEGTLHETRVWVVDHDGAIFIRGGSQPGGWSERAAANPDVRFARKGETRAYRAVPNPSDSMRETINGLFAAKYGWRDLYISYFVADPSRQRVRVLELEPRADG